MQKDVDSEEENSSVEGAIGGHDPNEDEEEDEGYYLQGSFDDDEMFGEDLDLKHKYISYH